MNRKDKITNLSRTAWLFEDFLQSTETSSFCLSTDTILYAFFFYEDRRCDSRKRRTKRDRRSKSLGGGGGGGETTLSKAALQAFMKNVGIYQTFKVQKWFFFQADYFITFVWDQVKTGSSESQAEELNQSQNVRCDWFILPLLFPTPKIWFSLDHKRNFSDGVA